MPLTPPEHAEHTDSISGHVKIEPHLETGNERNMSTISNKKVVRITQISCLADVEREGLSVCLSFPLRLIGALFAADRSAVREIRQT